MKLRLPSKLVAAIVAAASAVTFATLASGSLAAAEVTYTDFSSVFKDSDNGVYYAGQGQFRIDSEVDTTLVLTLNMDKMYSWMNQDGTNHDYIGTTSLVTWQYCNNSGVDAYAWGINDITNKNASYSGTPALVAASAGAPVGSPLLTYDSLNALAGSDRLVTLTFNSGAQGVSIYNGSTLLANTTAVGNNGAVATTGFSINTNYITSVTLQSESVLDVSGIVLPRDNSVPFVKSREESVGRIIFMGDSITHGVLDATWRWHMFKTFVDNGIEFELAGPMSGNHSKPADGDYSTSSPSYAGEAFENIHYAMSSGRTYNMITADTRYTQTVDRLGNENNVNTGVILIGTNDILSDTPNRAAYSTYKSKYEGLLGGTVSFSANLDPNATWSWEQNDSWGNMGTIIGEMNMEEGDTFYVMSIPVWGKHSNHDTETDHAAVAAYNGLLEQWAEAYSASHTGTVKYVDVNKGMLDLTSPLPFWGNKSFFNNGSDGLHPSLQGSLLMAGNVAHAMGIGGRTAGLVRSGATVSGVLNAADGWAKDAEITHALSHGDSLTIAENVFSKADGYTIDFKANFGDGGTLNGEGWLDGNKDSGYGAAQKVTNFSSLTNFLAISVGDGENCGTLKLAEGYITWAGSNGDQVLYCIDNSQNNANIRVAYHNGSIDAGDNVLSGYYVWLDDMLIGQGLQAVRGENTLNGITLGLTSPAGATGSVSNLAWADKAYAPTVAPGTLYDADHAYIVTQINDKPNRDNLAAKGLGIEFGPETATGTSAAAAGSGEVTTTLTGQGNNYYGAVRDHSHNGTVSYLISTSTNGNAFGVVGGSVNADGTNSAGDVNAVFRGTAETPITVAAGTYGALRGSFLGAWNGSIAGDLNVEISHTAMGGDIWMGIVNNNNSRIKGDARLIVNTGSTISGNIYGGSYVNGVMEGNSSIEINGGTVSGDIVAGGTAGTIKGNTAVTITGGVITGSVNAGAAGSAVIEGTSSLTVVGSDARIGGSLSADNITLSDIAPDKDGYTGGMDQYRGAITATDQLTLHNYTAAQVGSSVTAQHVLLTGNSNTTISNLTLTACTITAEAGSELTLADSLYLGNPATYSGNIIIADGISFSMSENAVAKHATGFSYSDGESGFLTLGSVTLMKPADDSPLLVVGDTTTYKGTGMLAGATFSYDTSSGILSAHSDVAAGTTYYVNDEVVYARDKESYSAGHFIISSTGDLQLNANLKRGVDITSNGGKVTVGEGIVLSHASLTANETTTMAGSGTYALAPTGNNDTIALGNNLSLDAAWTGAVQVTSTATTGNGIVNMQAAHFNALGNANSWVELAGVRGYFATGAQDFSANLLLTGENALVISNGSSSNSNLVFNGKIAGSGTMEYCYGRSNAGVVFAGDISKWTGRYNQSNSVQGYAGNNTTLTLQGAATTLNAAIDYNTASPSGLVMTLGDISNGADGYTFNNSVNVKSLNAAGKTIILGTNGEGDAATHGALTVAGAATIGTLKATGAGTTAAFNGTTTIDNLTADSSAFTVSGTANTTITAVTVNSGKTLTLQGVGAAGDVTNSGTLVLNGATTGYIQNNNANSAITVTGEGISSVNGFNLSAANGAKTTVTIESGATLHITGTTQSSTGNDGSFMLSEWNTSNTVNVYGTLISEAAFSGRDGTGNISVKDGGVLEMRKGLSMVGNKSANTLTVESGGTLRAGATTSDSSNKYTLTLQDGANLEGYYGGNAAASIAQNMVLGSGENGVNIITTAEKELTLTGILSGNTALNVQGGGTLVLDSASTHISSLTLGEGSVTKVNNVATLGSVTGNGGELDLGSNHTVQLNSALALGSGTLTIGENVRLNMSPVVFATTVIGDWGFSEDDGQGHRDGYVSGEFRLATADTINLNGQPTTGTLEVRDQAEGGKALVLTLDGSEGGEYMVNWNVDYATGDKVTEGNHNAYGASGITLTTPLNTATGQHSTLNIKSALQEGVIISTNGGQINLDSDVAINYTDISFVGNATTTMGGQGALKVNTLAQIHNLVDNDRFAFADSWSGGVQISGSFNEQNSNYTFDHLTAGTNGHLEFAGFTGYDNNWHSGSGNFCSDVKLTDVNETAAWKFTPYASNGTYTFKATGKWSGDGTFWAYQNRVLGYEFTNDISEWEGTFKFEGNTNYTSGGLKFSGEAHEVNAEIAKASGTLNVYANTDVFFNNKVAADSLTVAADKHATLCGEIEVGSMTVNSGAVLTLGKTMTLKSGTSSVISGEGKVDVYSHKSDTATLSLNGTDGYLTAELQLNEGITFNQTGGWLVNGMETSNVTYVADTHTLTVGTNDLFQVNTTVNMPTLQSHMQAQGAAKAVLVGAGTLELAASTTGPAALPTGVSLGDATQWTGVVKLSNISGMKHTSNHNLDAYRNAASWVELNGVSGWDTHWAGTLEANLILENTENSVAWDYQAGASSMNYMTLNGQVKGEGTLQLSANTTNQGLKFDGDISGWTGALTATAGTNKEIWFQSKATEVNVAINESGYNNVKIQLKDITNGAAGYTFNRVVKVATLTTNDKRLILGSYGEGADATPAALTVTGNATLGHLVMGEGTTATIGGNMTFSQNAAYGISGSGDVYAGGDVTATNADLSAWTGTLHMTSGTNGKRFYVNQNTGLSGTLDFDVLHEGSGQMILIIGSHNSTQTFNGDITKAQGGGSTDLYMGGTWNNKLASGGTAVFNGVVQANSFFTWDSGNKSSIVFNNTADFYQIGTGGGNTGFKKITVGSHTDENGTQTLGNLTVSNGTKADEISIESGASASFAGTVTTGTLTVSGEGSTVNLNSSAHTINNLVIDDGATATSNRSDGTGFMKGTVAINAGGTLKLTNTNSLGWGNNGTASITMEGEEGKLATLAVSDKQTFSSTLNLNGYTNVINGEGSSGNKGLEIYQSDDHIGTINATGTNNTISTGVFLRNLTTVTTKEGAELTISGVVRNGVAEGTADLVKDGAGTLTLSGTNTFTGGLTIENGKIIAANNTALGNVDQNRSIIIKSGGVLDVNGLQGTGTGYAVTLAGGTLMNGGAEVLAGWRQFVTALTLTADSTVDASGNNYGMIGSNYAATSITLDTHVLEKTGAATYYLTNTAITGSSTEEGTGTLKVSEGTLHFRDKENKTGSLGADIEMAGGSVTTESGSSIHLSKNVAVTATKAGSVFSAAVDLGSNTLTVGGTQELTMSGAISGTAGSLLKTDENTIILSGSNTIAGTTTVNDGTLKITNDYTTNVVSISGGNLLVDANNKTVDLGSAFTMDSGSFTLTNGTVNQNEATFSATNSIVNIEGGVYKTGSNGMTIGRGATLNLSAADGSTSRLQGSVTVQDGGKMVLLDKDATGYSGGDTSVKKITVDNGGQLLLGFTGANETFAGTLVLNGTLGVADGITTTKRFDMYGSSVIQVSANANALMTDKVELCLRKTDAELNIGNNATLTLSGTLSGGNTLRKTGNGSLVIAGALDNSFSGDTKVESGTLKLENNSANKVRTLDDVTLGQGAVLSSHFAGWGSDYKTTLQHVLLDGDAATLDVTNFGGWMSVGSIAGEGTLTLQNSHESNAHTTFAIGGSATTAEQTLFHGELAVKQTSTGDKRATVVVFNDEYSAADAVLSMSAGDIGGNRRALGIGLNSETVKLKGINDKSIGTAGANSQYQLFSGSGENLAQLYDGGTTYFNNAADGTKRTLELTGNGEYSTSVKVGANINLKKSGEGTQTFTGDMSDFDGSLTATEGTLQFLQQATALNVQDLTITGSEGHTAVIEAREGAAASANADIYVSGKLTANEHAVLNGDLTLNSTASLELNATPTLQGMQLNGALTLNVPSADPMLRSADTDLITLSDDMNGYLATLGLGDRLTLFTGVTGLNGETSSFEVSATQYFDLVTDPERSYMLTYTAGNGDEGGIVALAVVPEPTTSALSLLALAGLAARRRRH